ncbi:MAG: hypothetical protein ACK56F_29920, partial [bacterium]
RSQRRHAGTADARRHRRIERSDRRPLRLSQRRGLAPSHPPTQTRAQHPVTTRPRLSRALAALVLIASAGCAALRGPVVPPPPPPITPPMLAAADSFLVRIETSKGAMDL